MSQYFPGATGTCPTFDADSPLQPLVDAKAYFAQLDALLDTLAAGDAVVIASLSVDPGLDLTGKHPGEPGYRALGDRLADLAASGVAVWVLMAGRVLASSLPVGSLGDFRDNAERAVQLRSLQRPAGSASTPLRGRVLIDFSGSLLGSNHLKTVAVRRGQHLSAFLGGIDLENNRWDAAPHDHLQLDGARWGWHDIAARVEGPAAARVWDILAQRWREAATLPHKHYLRHLPRWTDFNPGTAVSAPPPAPAQPAGDAEGTAVRVLRSTYKRKFDSLLPWRRIEWAEVPAGGYQEVFETLRVAIRAARRFIYVEDQYLGEETGGVGRYELYPYLVDAIRRGVKVIMVGSGVRDPGDPGLHVRPINRTLNKDLQTKIADRLDGRQRRDFAVYRLEHATVHAKLWLIDDVFASIGSANMFSRSMSGVDNELSVAVVTTTPLVRQLRVQLWAEHLRCPVTEDVRAALEDADLALGIWDEHWLPRDAAVSTWHKPDSPPGFTPAERVLHRVDQ